MKKVMLILTSGVTIEFQEQDEVSIGIVDGYQMEDIEHIEAIPLYLISSATEETVYAIRHVHEDRVMYYYVPHSRISWCYLTMFKDDDSYDFEYVSERTLEMRVSDESITNTELS